MNDRPLTTLSDQPNDLCPITPSSFLGQHLGPNTPLCGLHDQGGLRNDYRIYSNISRIFLFENIAKKVMCDLYTNISSALYATQNFFEIFSCYCFLWYRLSYDRVTYRLSTRITLHCIFLPPYRMLMRMFQR